MGVMPFLVTYHACELLYCVIFLFIFEWRIKFSLFLDFFPAVPADTTVLQLSETTIC